MRAVLVDTSVWIDALKGKQTWQTRLFSSLIDENSVVICPTIIQEILQGIKHDLDYISIKNNLMGFNLIEMNPVEAACGAATLYRSARKGGVTVRKSNDCLIAFYAISRDVYLLHNDGDFNKLAELSSLKILTKGLDFH